MESPKAGIVIKENPLYDNSDSASSKSKKQAHPDVMSVMMVDITVEVAMAKMERKINFLMKVVEERNLEIIALREQIRNHEAAESSQTLVDMIANAIRAQYEGPPQTSFMYSKSYTKRINNLRMPLGYQPPKFQQFDGKELEVIDSWEQLEIEFLNRFYSTRRVVSMMELTNTKQRKGEPVIDYSNRWRALSLDCKDKLTELSAVEMCTQGKVDDPNYCKYHRVISHPVEKCFVLKELILKLARENKIELNIDKVAQTNHVAFNMTSSFPPSILLYDQRESLIRFRHFEPILVRFQQKIMTSNSQNKEEPIEDEGKKWIVVAHKKERQISSVQTKSHFHQKHSKGNISHKKKGRRKKKLWKPKPIKGKDEDFLQPRQSITLAEFLRRSFLEDLLEEILEVTACHTTNVVEVDNNYDSYEEVDNSNEIKQRTSVFDRIKPLATRSSVFQSLSMATKEEEKPMSNNYLHSNFSFQKAKYLHIKERSTFNICF
ncbi:ty3-gypsy retrotransposon protein [Cucumis melo var. makuwa]|uniref:Ty3-gypsy retrotransposon protein n=1 Tax=Cucumis melo var. makuwa TaxID=1194695 RepID=A0A5D3D362_CUCMM|nr:ty3-gypsy retrotransposon protein [Cucumis melo var. makuwa]TYK17079.1 ty3-gypsy retrotransposon protein [Cucumis melo var. makuwa]